MVLDGWADMLWVQGREQSGACSRDGTVGRAEGLYQPPPNPNRWLAGAAPASFSSSRPRGAAEGSQCPHPTPPLPLRPLLACLGAVEREYPGPHGKKLLY